MIWAFVVMFISFILDIFQLNKENVTKKEYIFYSISMVIVIVFAIVYYNFIVL